MKKIYLLTLIFILTFSFTACGKNTEEILAFQNELNTAIAKIESLNNELNSIDVTSPDAPSTALESLSNLKDAFDTLANIDVTDEEFSYIAGLADEGAEYMSQAYELFEKAYGQEDFDKENADLAYKYLERATTRIRVIVTMLHGEVPEGVIVH